MFIKLIEYIENTNIFLFTTNELSRSNENYKDGSISFPYYTKGYYCKNTMSYNTILIFEHNGTDNKGYSIPQCELIFMHTISNDDTFNFKFKEITTKKIEINETQKIAKNLVFTRSLQEFYKENNKFFINGKNITNYNFEYIYEITSQYIDSFGKTRIIQFGDVVLETSPLEPRTIANDELLINAYVSGRYKYTDVNILQTEFDFKIKYIIIEDNKVNSIVFNLEGDYPEFTINIDYISKTKFADMSDKFIIKNYAKESIKETNDINNYNLYTKFKY